MGRPPAKRCLDERASFVDLRAIPPRAVLVLEENDFAVGRGASVSARVVEEHQREEPARRRLLRHPREQQPAQANRLCAKLSPDQHVAIARRVAFREDEVDHRHHRLEALESMFFGRDAERDPRVADLALRANQALRHGRGRHQKGVGDGLRREAAKRTEREGHLGFERESGMAASKDEAKLVVLEGNGVILGGASRSLFLGLLRRGERGLLSVEGGPTPQSIDGLVTRRPGEPAFGSLRYSIGFPLLDGHRESILQGVLGEIEVAAAGANEGG